MNKQPSSNQSDFFDPQAEQEVISGVVHGGEDPGQLGLSPGDFHFAETRKLWRILLSMSHRNEAITPEAVISKAVGAGIPREKVLDIVYASPSDALLSMQVKRLKQLSRKRDIQQITERYLAGKLSEERWRKTITAMENRQSAQAIPQPIPMEALFTEKHPENIWANVLFRGALHLLSSDPGVGKTTLCYALAVSIAEGRAFLGEQLPQLKVGYFDLETPGNLRALKLRMLNYAGNNLLFFGEACPAEMLKVLVQKYRLEVLIIDPVSLFFKIRKEEDNAEANTSIVQPLKALCRETGVTVILVHHSSKGAKERSKVYRSRGASALPAGCDVVVNMESTAESDALKLEVVKNRISGYAPTIYLQKMEGNFEITEKPDSEHSKVQKVEKAILQLLRTQERATPGWLANAIAFACKKTIQRALQNLLTTGKVVKLERGEYTLSEGQERDMCKIDVPNVPKCLGTAWEADFSRDKQRDKEKDMSLSGELKGQKGHDNPPHTPLKLSVLSLMSQEEGTGEGTCPFDVPNDVPSSNPHGKRISGTKGQKGHQNHTCPFDVPKDDSNIGGETVSAVSPSPPKIKSKRFSIPINLEEVV